MIGSLNRSEEICADISRRIDAGEFKPGDKLCSEDELAKSYRASKSSVNRAIRLLEEKGVVDRSRRGTFLKNRSTAPVKSFLERKRSGEKTAYAIYTFDAAYDRIHWGEHALRALEKVARENGVTLAYKQIANDIREKEFLELVDSLLAEAPRALVFSVGGNYCDRHINVLAGRYRDIEIPIAIHNRAAGVDLTLPFHSVSLDSFSDGAAIGERVADKGLKNVCFAYAGLRQYPWSVARAKGVFSRLSPKDFNIVENESFRDIADVIEGFDAKGVIIAINAEIGAEIMDALQAKGLRAPNDYELIAFDDNPMYYSHNISAMRPPQEEIGALLGHIAFDKSLYNTGGHLVNIRVKSEYIERNTFKSREARA